MRARLRSAARRVSATSRRSPASSVGAVRRRVSLTCPALPDARLHVALRAEDDVDDGAVVEVRLRVEVRGEPRAVQLPALLQLVSQRVEEVVLLDAADDLLLVVEGDVGADGTGKAGRLLGRLDERHGE